MFNAGPAHSNAGLALVADLVTLLRDRICASAELQQNAAPRALAIANVAKRINTCTEYITFSPGHRNCRQISRVCDHAHCPVKRVTHYP